MPFLTLAPGRGLVSDLNCLPLGNLPASTKQAIRHLVKTRQEEGKRLVGPDRVSTSLPPAIPLDRKGLLGDMGWE